jgi:hypothetical protein
VISGASRGAWRRGRYANRSRLTPISGVSAAATSSTTTRATSEVLPQPKAVTPRLKVHRPMKAPSMKTSPWAKLMSWMMPYTIV